MTMTDTSIRAAKPLEKQYKLYDAGGLFIIVRPSGQKLWRFKYRFNDKEQQLTVGTYPITGLKEARAKRDDAKRLLAEGIDRSADKKRKAIAAAIQANNTFGAVAREFLDKLDKQGGAKATKIRNERCIKQLDADTGFDFQPMDQLVGISIQLGGATGRLERRLNNIGPKVFADRVPRKTSSSAYLTDRYAIPKCPAPDDAQ